MVVRTKSLRTKSARHRVDQATISGQSIDRTFVNYSRQRPEKKSASPVVRPALEVADIFREHGGGVAHGRRRLRRRPNSLAPVLGVPRPQSLAPRCPRVLFHRLPVLRSKLGERAQAHLPLWITRNREEARFEFAQVFGSHD